MVEGSILKSLPTPQQFLPPRRGAALPKSGGAKREEGAGGDFRRPLPQVTHDVLERDERE